MTRIACQQLAPQLADLAVNHRLPAGSTRRAVDAGAGVVVLPELVTSGCVIASRAEAASVAITPAHQLFADWAAEAARGPAGCRRGSASAETAAWSMTARRWWTAPAFAVSTAKRTCGTPDAHLRARHRTRPVFDTAAGRVGILICYDLEFPEMPRTLALGGPISPPCPPTGPWFSGPGRTAPEVIIAMAAARANRVFSACCDRTGAERRQHWTAGTAIIGESGRVISTAGTQAPATADVDLTAARDKTLAGFSDAFGDHRPELYPAVITSGKAPLKPTPDASSFNPVSDDAQAAPGAMPARLACGAGAPGPPSGSQPLVLLAGMLGDADVWDDVAAALADRATPQVCRIDLDDSVPEMAESVLAAAPGRFALAGHSLGAIVALEVMRQAPRRVTRLALLHSTARPASARQLTEWAALRKRTEAGDFAGVARDLALTNLPPGRHGDGRLADRLERMALKVGADGFLRQLQAQGSRPDSRPFLAGIAVATLVVSGALDEVCPGELQQELAVGIEGSRLVTIETAGHMSMLEAPAAVAEVMATWLSPPKPH